MEYIFIYCVIAAATSISSLYEIIWPELRDARAQGIKNPLTQNPLTALLVSFVVNFIVAPYWMITLLVPQYTIAATMGVRQVMREPQQEN